MEQATAHNSYLQTKRQRFIVAIYIIHARIGAHDIADTAAKYRHGAIVEAKGEAD